MNIRASLIAAALALAGCGAGSGFDWQPTPGTGWSRAPDLSVYAAMTEYADIALEQEMLCQGFDPQNVTRRWEREYGGRQQAVRTGLTARHGAAAVAEAETADAVVRQAECRDFPNDRWRHRYVRLLRLLEVRLATS